MLAAFDADRFAPEVWDDEGRFIAYGAQAMYLHNLSGEPPTIDASGFALGSMPAMSSWSRAMCTATP